MYNIIQLFCFPISSSNIHHKQPPSQLSSNVVMAQIGHNAWVFLDSQVSREASVSTIHSFAPWKPAFLSSQVRWFTQEGGW